MKNYLTPGEKFFLSVHSNFEFLRLKGYEGSSFSLGGREFWVSFYNHLKNKKITIVQTECGLLEFYIETKSWSGWRRKNGRNYFEQEKSIENVSHLVELIKKMM